MVNKKKKHIHTHEYLSLIDKNEITENIKKPINRNYKNWRKIWKFVSIKR